MLVGVDIGGTFTDLALSVAGQLRIHKLPSTPHDPAEAMLAGLAAVTPGGLAALAHVLHGSTVATNAILERKGARTALITSQGFRDLLAIGRQDRPALYALWPQLPPLLIPRRWCYEVPERLDPSGAVHTPLDLAALDAVLDDLSREGIEALAVCLLYSFVDPTHERAVRERVLARGLLDESAIALSCEVLPQFREFERASTVALEAYVRPVMGRYLRHLEEALPANCSLQVMKSDGGLMSARRARQAALQTALSGPAAGVIGAFYLAQQAGYDHVITLDMGGTSTDVALCPGAPVRRAEAEIDGLPLRTRLIDIETVGAGGGSLARVDAGGALCVGPESAGADPGPVAYGRGGRQPTLTDANLVLGRLDPDRFLGGRMPLYPERAREALAALGKQLGSSPEQAALGVVDVASANVERALRRVSVERGHDPRDFTLLPFGGAGPLHACQIAERLDIPRVLVPRYPGVLCAMGLLTADVVLDYGRSVLIKVAPLAAEGLPTAGGALGDRIADDEQRINDAPSSLAALPTAGGTAGDRVADDGQDTNAVPAAVARLQDALEGMIARAREDLAREGVPEARMTFSGLVDARYAGQSHELTIPFSPDLAAAFHAAHARAYGHAMPERAVEVVTLRLEATGQVDKPVLAPEPTASGDSAPSALIAQSERPASGQVTGAGWCGGLNGGAALVGRRSIHFPSTPWTPAGQSELASPGEGTGPGLRSGPSNAPLDCACYDRERLPPGAVFDGPALVLQMDSTVLVPPGWSARVDGYHNLILERRQ